MTESSSGRFPHAAWLLVSSPGLGRVSPCTPFPTTRRACSPSCPISRSSAAAAGRTAPSRCRMQRPARRRRCRAAGVRARRSFWDTRRPALATRRPAPDTPVTPAGKSVKYAAYLPTYLRAYSPTHLLTHSPTHPLIHSSTHPLTYVPTYLLIYLPTYLLRLTCQPLRSMSRRWRM